MFIYAPVICDEGEGGAGVKNHKDFIYGKENMKIFYEQTWIFEGSVSLRKPKVYHLNGHLGTLKIA